MLDVATAPSEVGKIAADWPIRNQHWTAEIIKGKQARSPRKRNPEPLILSGFGISLKVDRGSLLVRNGFTHHPQTNEALRFFPGDLDNPDRIIVLDGSGSLSFDVLSWLSEQNVSLIRINWKGEAVCVAAGSGYAADQQKIDWQRSTRADTHARLKFASGQVEQKLLASLETLRSVLPETSTRQTAIDRAEEGIAEIRADTHDIPRLRGIEGRCAKPYFAAWSGLEMRWAGEKRLPVPPAWRTYRNRSTTLSGVKARNWKASHPINAMLNYAYGTLESLLRIRTLSEGYDPRLGIYHHGDQGSPAYVFDLMEPYRPKIDRAVLEFALSETFSVADFVLRSDGVCRLSPALAARIVQLVSI